MGIATLFNQEARARMEIQPPWSILWFSGSIPPWSESLPAKTSAIVRQAKRMPSDLGMSGY